MRTVSQVAGCGSYLPARVVTNHELASRMDTSDEWIVARSGIRQRHIAAEGEMTSDLAIAASRKALESAGMDAADLDLLIVATTTPDRTFPATATTVQAGLGMTKGAAFDLQAVCSGFVYGLSVADNFIKTGQARNALVIGAETMSRVLDWEDRSTCVLFGDGAGAVVLRGEKVNGGSDRGSNLQRGVISTHLHSDGRFSDILNTDGGVSATRTVGYLRMAGKEVFRHAVVNLAQVLVETLDHNGLKISDVDWLVPHQANKRIIDGVATKLGLDLSKVILTIEHHANTSSASIPLALDEGVRDGRIKRGDLVLVEAMGAGLTWGSGLIRW